MLVFYPYLSRIERAWRRRTPAMPLCALPIAKRERGAAMLEFTIIAMALLFFGLAWPREAARWHITRQIAYMALTEAARAAATDPIRPRSLQTAFEQALLRLNRLYYLCTPTLAGRNRPGKPSSVRLQRSAR